MARTLHKFVNTVGWRLDRQSWNDVKKQSKQLAKQLERANPQTILNPDGTSGTTSNRRRRQPEHDAHARQYRKLNAEQKKFEQTQRTVLKRFVLSNAAIRDLDVSEKKVLLTKLKQAKTVQELLHLEKKLKSQITDRNRRERTRTRELQKQQGISKNLAANLAGVYAAAASGNAVIQTGLNFESIERSFLVVTGSAKQAKQEFSWVRDEANRLGIDVGTLAQSFVSFRASVGDKLTLQQTRDLFTSVSEASIAMGLNTEKQQRAMVAINQMASKNTITSEELVSQLSEALPGSVALMAKAAQEAGKISKELSAVEAEKELRRLMSQGKILASDVLPAFANQLSLMANKNDQLAWSLRTSLNVQLARAGNNIRELGNSMFEGLKPALLSITKSFNLLSSEGKGLAKVLGSGIGSALKALSFPFVMLGALLIDAYNGFKDLTGATDEGITKFATFGAKVLGLSFGITRLVGGFKMLWNIGSKVVGFFTGGSKAASTMAKGVGGINAGLRGSLSLFSRLNVYLTALLAVFEARPGGSMSFTSLFGDSKTAKWWDTPVLEHLRRTGKEITSNQQKVDVNIHVRSDIDSSGSIIPVVRTEIDNAEEQRMIGFYQNLSASN